MKKYIEPRWLGIYLSVLMGCTRSISFQEAATVIYQGGDLVLTEKKMQSIPAQKDTQCKDTAYFLLNRGLVHLAIGKVDASIADFTTALDAIDYYKQTSSAETMGQWLIEDSVGAYVPPLYEQILARFYCALALFQKKDLGNARALLLQAENLIDLCQELKISEEGIHNPLIHYLLASVLEHEGDFSNARIFYEKAGSLIGMSKVMEDLKRIENPQRITSIRPTVVCLGHNGHISYKISHVVPASIVSAELLELFFLRQNMKPALSTLTGIRVPQFVNASPSPLEIQEGKEEKKWLIHYPIDPLAQWQLSQEMPWIACRAAARQLLRRGIVGALQNKEETLGFLADLSAFIANANTEADTRSWSTLPFSIELARLELDPGEHELIFISSSNRKKIRIQLQEKDLCIVNVFNPSCGPMEILAQGESS